MDSEGPSGSVLVCTPSPSVLSPVNLFASTSVTPSLPDVESGSTSKPKKKRSKHKPKNSIKELNQDVCDGSPNLPRDTTLNSLVGMIQNLQTTESSLIQKAKKARTRKKTGNEKEKKTDGACDLFTNASQPQKVEVPINFRYEDTVKDKSQFRQKNSQTESPKGKDPFFPDNKNKSGKKKSISQKRSENQPFGVYLSVADVDLGLKDKSMVAGAIRINQRCYKEAYISSEGDEKDIMIEGLLDRNGALEGDEVVVLINPPDLWKSSGQRTAKVVYIREQFHSRSCIGKLPSSLEPNSTYVVFSPRDPRVPRIKIPLGDSSLPPTYLYNPSLYSDKLLYAQITAWNDANFAQGIIVKEVGSSGDLEVETLAILLENNLDPRPINPMLNMFFPSLPYTIPEEEIAKRLDLRKECIFTIDPATARDLDDAVSTKRLGNGNIEVGVHISDVSHFLQPNTLLDHTVCKRATTIYLVQRVYHMLPVELCHLCSLTPGDDKLAFSVFVEFTPDAQVVSHRFARSVIHSCVKMAYEHAQMVIDNPDKMFTSEDFPDTCNGITAEQCAATIRELFGLSVIMRKRRFDSGALRIDQPKLCFHLDEKSQTPLSSFIYENKESHRLIEEFMLLANMTVAKHIYKAYPTLAFLRRHLPPKINMMVELQKRMESFGIHLDITDAGTVHDSMLKYISPLEDEDELTSWARYIVLNNLCAKPMLRAEYFCPSGECPELHHYALNAPCYTHFTSPIRRYADVIVHRLLAASLDLAPQPTWSPLDTKRIAMICNRQKIGAKNAGEQSSQLFLALYLREPVESAAAVIDVKDRSLDVIVKDYGIILRVYTGPLDAKVEHHCEGTTSRLDIKWNKSGQVQCVQLFSVVRVLVSCAKDSLKLTATLLPSLPLV